MPRVIGLGLGAVCLCAGLIQQGSPPWAWAAVVVNALLWPHLAYVWARRSADPLAAEHRNMLIDSVTGNFWVAAIGFNLLPSVLVTMMLAMDNVAAGGFRLLLRGALAQLAGVVLGVAVAGFSWHPTSSLATMVACVPFLIFYPLTLGWITFHLSLRLSLQKKELEWLMCRDALSGVFGRAYFDQRLDEEFALAQRKPRVTTLVIADIDHFKGINDSLGHTAGDDALRQVGQVLRDCVRSSDVLARYGGDEFAVMLIDATPADARVLVERVRQGLRELGGAPTALTMSFGMAALSPQHSSARQWLEHADTALYQVKRSGRDDVAEYCPRAEAEPVA